MRIEPPPSLPVAIETSPPATAAALPPDEPPGVRSVRQGLRVVPCRTVRVRFTPPNSLAVVCPARTTPASSTSRVTMVAVCSATRSASTAQPSLYGQPATRSSSFTPIGTPPKGLVTSAADAAASAASRGRWQKAFSSLASMAAKLASSSSTGERSPRRKLSTNEQASPCHGTSPMSSDRIPAARSW